MKSFKSTVLPTTRAETQASRDPLSQEQHTNLLTVVIPSIGRPSLKNAIESCLGQDLPSKHKMEVVLVDNTMTGELRELIDHYRDRDPRIDMFTSRAKDTRTRATLGLNKRLVPM